MSPYSQKTTSKTKPLAERLQKALVTIGYKNRGVKTTNYYVLKHTKAPALLLEIGFIDNTKDNELFDTKFNEIIYSIANIISTNLYKQALHRN